MERRSEGREVKVEWALVNIYTRRSSGLEDKMVCCFELDVVVGNNPVLNSRCTGFFFFQSK